MHYSAVNYWTPTWSYPRTRLREPYPRLRKRAIVELLPPSGPIFLTAAHGLSAGANPRYAYEAAGAAARYAIEQGAGVTPRFAIKDAGASGR